MKKTVMFLAGLVVCSSAVCAQDDFAGGNTTQVGVVSPADSSSGGTIKAAPESNGGVAYQYQFDNSYFGLDSSDMLVNYVRFFVEPTYKIKDQYSAGGFGVEAGVLAAYQKGYPYVGFSVGGFGFDSAESSDYRFTTVPVLLRAGADFPLSPNSQFSIVVGGGYSINNYRSSNPAVSVSCGNSYLLQGQAGLKFPLSNHITLGVYGGYSYMKPYISSASGGLTEGDYKTVDAPFIKLLLQF